MQHAQPDAQARRRCQTCGLVVSNKVAKSVHCGTLAAVS